MPHAALWVVQRLFDEEPISRGNCFNAARGFVGGAALQTYGGRSCVAVSMPHAALWVVQHCSSSHHKDEEECFNAARGFVGGAALFLIVR